MKPRLVATFLCGLVFSAGLCLSGMTNPNRVLGFLDIFGRWDPTLAFVMMGAVATHAVLYPLISRRAAPLFAPRFFSVGVSAGMAGHGLIYREGTPSPALEVHR